MAQRAAEAAKQRMDSDTERLLARILLERASLLDEHAASDGVLAFLRRPLRRERLNERFLHNTLRGVFSANRRSQQEEMWARREEQLRREQREKEEARRGCSRDRHRSRSRERDGERDARGAEQGRGGRRQRQSRRDRGRSRSRDGDGSSGGRERSRSRGVRMSRPGGVDSVHSLDVPACSERSGRGRGMDADVVGTSNRAWQPQPEERSHDRSRSYARSISRSRSRSMSGSGTDGSSAASSQLRSSEESGEEAELRRAAYRSLHGCDPPPKTRTLSGSEAPPTSRSQQWRAPYSRSHDSRSEEEQEEGEEEGEMQRLGRYNGGSRHEPRQQLDEQEDRRGAGGAAAAAAAAGPSEEGTGCGAEAAAGDEEEEGWIMTEGEVQAMLSRHRVKGRGGVGARADEPGPYLPEGYQETRSALAGVMRGPAAPSWLQRAAADAAASRGDMAAGTSGESSVADALLSMDLDELLQRLAQAKQAAGGRREAKGEKKRRGRKEEKKRKKKRKKEKKEKREGKAKERKSKRRRQESSCEEGGQSGGDE